MKKLFQEFKAFISRGNVLDMAVGVIIGGAFSAIVTALVSILMSVCTWGVPGGIKGLVTVLPAANDAQKGMDAALVVESGASLGQKFAASDLQALAKAEAIQIYTEAEVNDNMMLIESVKSTILSKYTLHGTTYTYNLSAVIDWGSFINAIISFLIIAVTLFIVVKVANKMHQVREKAQAKVAEELKKNKEEVEQQAE